MSVIHYVIQLNSVSSGASTTNVITIAVALIAAGAAVFSAVYGAHIAKKRNEETLKQQKEIAKTNFEQTRQENEKALIQQKEIAEKGIQADVVSKARIDWIQKERDYLIEYISLASNMKTYYAVWVDEAERAAVLKTPEKFLKHCEHPVKFQNTKNVLIMSLGPDDETGEFNNKDFIRLIKKVYKITVNMIENSFPEEESNKQKKKLKKLTEFSRRYFKNEWNKAKDGE